MNARPPGGWDVRRSAAPDTQVGSRSHAAWKNQHRPAPFAHVGEQSVVWAGLGESGHLTLAVIIGFLLIVLLSWNANNAPPAHLGYRQQDEEPPSSCRHSQSSGYSGHFSENSGLVGLRNIGNTCFLNSVTQCLSNTRCLLEYLVRDGYASDVNTSLSLMKGELIKAFASLLTDMWCEGSDNNRALNTSPFKAQIQKFAPTFSGYQQHDAQEFLRKLLEGLHEDVNRVTHKPRPLADDIDEGLDDSQKAMESWKRYLRFDDSKIVDMFVGQLKSTLQCSECGHCSVTFDPFWDLSLPIPNKFGQVSLYQCLELFTKEEIMDGDEKPTCSKCKERKNVKDVQHTEVPQSPCATFKAILPTGKVAWKVVLHSGLSIRKP